jgi:hypothetical protein
VAGRGARAAARADAAHCQQKRSRTGRARTGCYPGLFQRRGCAIAGGDPHHSDCVRGYRRPRRRRLCRESRATGGNATGFAVYEYSISGEWLEVLKEVAPRVARAAVLRPSHIAAGPGQFGTIQALPPSLGMELRPVNVRDATEIERALTEFAQGSDGGLIVFGSPGRPSIAA